MSTTRKLGLAALSAVAATTVSITGATPAHATPQRLCAVTDVPESSYSVPIRTLRPYESMTVTPGGSIWAGVWFTGSNGPEGWSGTVAPWYYPAPGAREYSLVARLAGENWRYVGNRATTFTNYSSSYRTLYARTNDNTPGNGSGAFTMTYCYYTS
jgi:hypothetical protein